MNEAKQQTNEKEINSNLQLALILKELFNPKTRNYQVIDYMLKNGSITSMQAITTYGNTRLAATIHKLKKLGLKIEKENIRNLEDTGNYARYSIKVD